MKERILINENSRIANKHISMLNQNVAIINSELVPLFDQFNIEFTHELLLSFVANQTAVIDSLIDSKANEDTKAFNTLLKDKLIELIEKQKSDFWESTDNIKQKLSLNLMEFITVENGRAMAIYSAEETIREACRTYVTTDTEHQLYEALNQFAEGYNKAVSMFGPQAKEILRFRKMDFFMGLFASDNFGETIKLNEDNNYHILINQKKY